MAIHKIIKKKKKLWRTLIITVLKRHDILIQWVRSAYQTSFSSVDSSRTWMTNLNSNNDAENGLGHVSKEKMKTKRSFIRSIRKIQIQLMRNEGLENQTLKRHTEDKRNRENLHITFLRRL